MVNRRTAYGTVDISILRPESPLNQFNKAFDAVIRPLRHIAYILCPLQAALRFDDCFKHPSVVRKRQQYCFDRILDLPANRRPFHSSHLQYDAWVINSRRSCYEKLPSQYVAINYTLLTWEELDELVSKGGKCKVDVSKKKIG